MPPLDPNERSLMPPLDQCCNGEDAQESGLVSILRAIFLGFGQLMAYVGFGLTIHGGAILLDCWGVAHIVKPEERRIDTGGAAIHARRHRADCFFTVKPDERCVETGLSELGVGIGLILVLFASIWVCFGKAPDAEGRGFGHGGAVGTGDDCGDGGDAGGDCGDADCGD